MGICGTECCIMHTVHLTSTCAVTLNEIGRDVHRLWMVELYLTRQYFLEEKQYSEIF